MRLAADFPIQVVDSIMIMVQLGKLVTKNRLFDFKSLVAYATLVELFVWSSVKGTQPRREDAALLRLGPIAIRQQSQRVERINSCGSLEEGLEDPQRSMLYVVTEMVTISGILKAVVFMKFNARGIKLLSTHECLVQKRLALIAEDTENLI